MAPYQGYRSWNAWNVALWIDNTEWLYDLACKCLHKTQRPSTAAYSFNRQTGLSRTPDGARYTHRSVVEYMSELQEALVQETTYAPAQEQAA